MVGGHDDQILADSELGVVSPVAEGFATGVSSFLVEWQSPRRLNRLDFRLDMAATGYGASIQGGDTEVSLGGAYRQALPRGLAVDAAFVHWWFRRSVDSGGAPVFDYDLNRLDLRLGMPLGSIWFLTLGAQRNWFTFPGRTRTVAGDLEAQNQNVLSVVLGRNVGRRNQITGSVLYRNTDSNVSEAKFDGLGWWLKAQFGLTPTWGLTLYTAYTRRDYPGLTVAGVTGEFRGDDAWQAGGAIQKALTDRLVLFLQGTYLHQTSSDPSFTYNQTRVGMGVELRLLKGAPDSRAWLPVGPPEDTLLPRSESGGIRFRYRDPGARYVSVVGGFNGWNPDRSPLSGPDASGLWEAVVPVPPGRWRYAFVVDGTWVAPPDALLYEDDGFGGRHGVLIVSPGSAVTGEETPRPKQEE